jgi:threonine dehydrogenase-like Zn-dependent dehydrogenase
MIVDARYHWLVAPGRIELRAERYDDAALKEGEVLCRTLCSAISPGTELAAFNGLAPLRPTASPYPRWLGYMNVAEVLASRGVQRPGALVYSHAAHRSHFVLGAGRVLAEVPRALDARVASLAYLYRLAWTGLRRGRGKLAGRIGIVGLGAIGLCAVQLARAFECEVVAVSEHASAAALARSCGAQVHDRRGAEAAFAALPEADGCDLVLVTTNAWRDWDIALAMTRFGAVVSVLGFPGRGGDAPAGNPLASRYFYDRQLSIMSAGKAGPAAGDGREPAAAEQRDLAEILGWLASGRLDAQALIAGVQPAADLAGAYRRLQKSGRAPGTVVLDWRE